MGENLLTAHCSQLLHGSTENGQLLHGSTKFSVKFWRLFLCSNYYNFCSTNPFFVKFDVSESEKWHPSNEINIDHEILKIKLILVFSNKLSIYKQIILIVFHYFMVNIDLIFLFQNIKFYEKEHIEQKLLQFEHKNNL